MQIDVVAVDTALRERGELVRHRGVIRDEARRHQPAGAGLQLVLQREEALRQQAVELVASDGPRQGRLVEDLAGGAGDAVIVEHHDARDERPHLGLVTRHLGLKACRAIAGIDAGAASCSRAVDLGRRNSPTPMAVARMIEPAIVTVFVTTATVLREACHAELRRSPALAVLGAGHARGRYRRCKNCAGGRRTTRGRAGSP